MRKSHCRNLRRKGISVHLIARYHSKLVQNRLCFCETFTPCYTLAWGKKLPNPSAPNQRKDWAKTHELVGTADGCLNSYAWPRLDHRVFFKQAKRLTKWTENKFTIGLKPDRKEQISFGVLVLFKKLRYMLMMIHYLQHLGARHLSSHSVQKIGVFFEINGGGWR